MVLAEATEAEWRAAHRELSPEDLRFRDAALRDPQLLERSRFAVLEENRELIRHRVQPWPTFVGRTKLDEIKRVSLAVCDLIRAVPSRLLGNDAQAVSDFYGLGSPRHAAEILAPPDGIASTVGRGDFIDTAAGLQCIEFNFSPNVGGWESSILFAMLCQVPAVAAFLSGLERSGSVTPTLHLFFLHLVEEVRSGQLLAGELTVVLVHNEAEEMPGSDGSPQRLPYLEAELEKSCAAAGVAALGQVIACHYGQMELRGDGVFVSGRRVQAIVELCHPTFDPPVYPAFKAGQIVLFNGPLELILSNKRNVALLSEHAASDVWSPEEREVIRRHVPWSRRVVAQRVVFHGEEADLADLLIHARERLVLKEGASAGGEGVVLGTITPPAEWAEAVRTAFASGDWMVQERLESRPYLYQSGDYGCSLHDVIWGPFFFGATYGGMILRMQPKADGRPVNMRFTAAEGVAVEV